MRIYTLVFLAMATVLGWAGVVHIRSINHMMAGVQSVILESKVNQARHWETSRQETLAVTEKGSSILRQARLSLADSKPLMPRDAAICLAARALIDTKLTASMGPGKEFHEDMVDWHAQNAAIDTFCAYALHVGQNK